MMVLTFVMMLFMGCSVMGVDESVGTVVGDGGSCGVGVDSVDDSSFVALPIDSAILKRIVGRSYRTNEHIGLQDLRYIKVLHYDFEGMVRIGEMICNKLIADDLLKIFKELYDNKYPIQRMVLVDEYGADDEASMSANNSSCFNYRTINGSKTLSLHSKGLAVDINPLYNPCVRMVKGKVKVAPKKGRRYADRSKSFRFKIDRNDLCYRIFTRYGFRWGGEWRSVKDYQHFEKRQ